MRSIEIGVNGTPANGWKNKNRTSDRKCKCGSWKQHWINMSGKKWPSKCSVEGCLETPSEGVHIININGISGEWIVPGCFSCNGKSDVFSLRAGTILVSANRHETCEATDIENDVADENTIPSQWKKGPDGLYRP
jgi:hypothetical protein